jgi:hypothetical protein
MATDNGAQNGAVESPAAHHMWTERKLIIIGLLAALWAAIAGAISLTLLGHTVPNEIYLLATGAMGSLATLVTPLSRKPPPTTGGNSHAP